MIVGLLSELIIHFYLVNWSCTLPNIFETLHNVRDRIPKSKKKETQAGHALWSNLQTRFWGHHQSHRIENSYGRYWIFLVPFDSLCHFDQIIRTLVPKRIIFKWYPCKGLLSGGYHHNGSVTSAWLKRHYRFQISSDRKPNKCGSPKDLSEKC